MPKIQRLRELVDEKAEVAGWLLLVLAALGRYFEKLDQWPTVGLVALSMTTLLGVQYFRGLSIGPAGIGVDDD